MKKTLLIALTLILLCAAGAAAEEQIVALYVNNAPVTGFSYRNGSFIPCTAEGPVFTSETELRMAADVGGDEIYVTLPDGFSFEHDDLYDYATLEGAQDIAVYPIYSETRPEAVEILVEGAIEATLSYPVTAPEKTTLIGKEVTEDDFTAAAPSNRLWSDMAAGYNADLAWACDLLTFPGSTDTQKVRSNFESLGFVDIKWHPLNTRDKNGLECWIASRTIVEDGSVRHIIGMVDLGYYESAQWVGNFTVYGVRGCWGFADPNMHYGFEEMAHKLSVRLDAYCTEHNIDQSRAGLFMTGHSRGGAATNILVHEYTGRFADAVGYAFATPNFTQKPSNDPNIHNFVSHHDIVPYLPNWGGYGKYGNIYVFGKDEPADATVMLTESLHHMIWSTRMLNLTEGVDSRAKDAYLTEVIVDTFLASIGLEPKEMPWEDDDPADLLLERPNEELGFMRWKSLFIKTHLIAYYPKEITDISNAIGFEDSVNMHIDNGITWDDITDLMVDVSVEKTVAGASNLWNGLKQAAGGLFGRK